MPIHETDLEENRFRSDEWKYYELWEKVEVRLRRRKALWMFLVVVIFLAISSVPVFLDQAPRWRGKAALRELADQINQIKVEVIAEQKPIRLSFEGNHYKVELVPSCESMEIGTVLREGELLTPMTSQELVRLSREEGAQLGIGVLADQFCYHPTQGFMGFQAGAFAFGIIPKSDWSDREDRRVALLMLNDLDYYS